MRRCYPGKVDTRGEQVKIRVLVALEEDYHAYRDMIAAALRVLRPSVSVEIAGLEVLEQEMEHFDPHLVICSLPSSVDSAGYLAWVQLPMHPTRPMKVQVGGRHSERSNPRLEMLLEIVDEVERLAEERAI